MPVHPQSLRRQANAVSAFDYAGASGPTLPSSIAAINTLNQAEVSNAAINKVRRNDTTQGQEFEFTQQNQDAYNQWAQALDPSSDDFDRQLLELDPRALDIPGIKEKVSISMRLRDDFVSAAREETRFRNSEVSRLRSVARGLSNEDRLSFERSVREGKSAADLDAEFAPKAQALDTAKRVADEAKAKSTEGKAEERRLDALRDTDRQVERSINSDLVRAKAKFEKAKAEVKGDREVNEGKLKNKGSRPMAPAEKMRDEAEAELAVIQAKHDEARATADKSRTAYQDFRKGVVQEVSPTSPQKDLTPAEQKKKGFDSIFGK